MRSGRRPKELEVSGSHGGEKSYRKSSPGTSPDGKSAIAGSSKMGISPKSRSSISTCSPGNSIKEFLKRLGDSEAFSVLLKHWLDDKLSGGANKHPHANSPFQLDELRQFDFALEGVQFQQLLRMPAMSSSSSSSSSSALSVEAEMCLAVEDFLHASAQGLWETFWSADDPSPYFVTGSHGFGSKNAYGEKNSSKKVKGPHCAALVGKSGGGANALWEHILEFVLLKPDLSVEVGRLPDTAVIGQAVFYALHMLLSRKMARSKSAVHMHSDTAFVLLVNSHFGSVVKVEGDVNDLDTSTTKVYDNAVAWVQERAHIRVSPVEQVWNRLGNANWGDIGALQLLFATFHSMEQCKGTPRKSISELATDHNLRLQQRRLERRILEVNENGSDMTSRHQSKNHREIEEIEEEIEPDIAKEMERMKLGQGTILWLEDSHWQRGFKVLDDSVEGRSSVYRATALDDVGKILNVYVGAHPSQLEPSWEDMSTWYQVQRQTRVLNVMKQRGISSKYLPQLVASGRILHPGSCTKQSPGGRCNHPWCGTPILVTSPVGESLDVVQKHGVLSPEEALKCCHDCLSALRSAGSAGIQHGDITPEHVLRVVGGDGDSYHVLVEWGHAVLEDRDSPGISLRFSSTYALQEGKLCPASDSESLVYLLYFLCGGSTPHFDSIESALQWRERSWARRAIQQQLGEVSAVLKAFADYVDSLCGTPYPVDYDIWFRRLNRALHGEETGKRMESFPLITRRVSEIAESSGTSGASPI